MCLLSATQVGSAELRRKSGVWCDVTKNMWLTFQKLSFFVCFFKSPCEAFIQTTWREISFLLERPKKSEMSRWSDGLSADIRARRKYLQPSRSLRRIIRDCQAGTVNNICTGITRSHDRGTCQSRESSQQLQFKRCVEKRCAANDTKAGSVSATAV